MAARAAVAAASLPMMPAVTSVRAGRSAPRRAVRSPPGPATATWTTISRSEAFPAARGGPDRLKGSWQIIDNISEYGLRADLFRAFDRPRCKCCLHDVSDTYIGVLI